MNKIHYSDSIGHPQGLWQARKGFEGRGGGCIWEYEPF